LIHATRKTLSDAKDKVKDDEKSKIETAISELETALKGDDLAAIKAKTEALSEASGSLAQRMYAEAAAAQQGGSDGGGASSSKSDGDAVDAEFEEVKDDK
ncbi:MAG: Hsp70 family protein, partial [Pseudomonadales bacterium]|nr:Hsp70 family protein [Pseudomonadales bacterium]